MFGGEATRPGREGEVLIGLEGGSERDLGMSGLGMGVESTACVPPSKTLPNWFGFFPKMDERRIGRYLIFGESGFLDLSTTNLRRRRMHMMNDVFRMWMVGEEEERG